MPDNSNTEVQKTQIQVNVQNFEAQYSQVLEDATKQYTIAEDANAALLIAEMETLRQYKVTKDICYRLYLAAVNDYTSFAEVNQLAQEGNIFTNNAQSLTNTAAVNASSFSSFASIAQTAIETALRSIGQLKSDVASATAIISAECESTGISEAARIATTTGRKAAHSAELASIDALNLTIAAGQSPVADAMSAITIASANSAKLANAISNTYSSYQSNLSAASSDYLASCNTANTEQLVNYNLQINKDAPGIVLYELGGFINSGESEVPASTHQG